MARWRGAKDLVLDAVETITNLVEETHTETVKQVAAPLRAIEPAAPDAIMAIHGLTAGVTYKTIRAVNHGVRVLSDLGADRLEATGAPAPRERSDEEGTLGWYVDQAEGALNGAIGDFLSRRGNGLDVGMTLRHQGLPLEPTREALQEALPEATGRVCVLVHGLSATEWSWSVASEHFHGEPGVNIGTQLARDAGYTPLFVRYNSGRHVSTNGALLSALLTELVAAWPHPIETLALVGHSMGGLVSRSAAHRAEAEGAPWLKHLDHVVCVGSPHLGAPLEKAANALGAALSFFNHPGTQVPAKVLKARSEGIKDLRYGYIHDAEWQGQDPDALWGNNAQGVAPIAGVTFVAIAGTLTQDPEHPVGALLGDLMVRVTSATHYNGVGDDGVEHIPFRAERVFPGTDHLRLANHPEVYAVVRRALQGDDLAG